MTMSSTKKMQHFSGHAFQQFSSHTPEMTLENKNIVATAKGKGHPECKKITMTTEPELSCMEQEGIC